MIETWKKIFSLKHFSLDHDEPIAFVVSQWQKEPNPSIVYLFYRWVIALGFFAVLVISIIDVENPNSSPSPKWLIYLTNWGYIMCTLQAIIVAVILSICALARYLDKPNLQTSTLKTYRFYWLTNLIATDIAFMITVLYWTLIYEPTGTFGVINLMVHGINSVLMMIDIFVVAHPTRLLHCCYPFAFGLCYTIFSVIYYAAGGTNTAGKVFIYDVLDWTNPGITILVCLGALVGVLILHGVSWGLHKLRIWIHSKYFTKAQRNESEMNMNEIEANEKV